MTSRQLFIISMAVFAAHQIVQKLFQISLPVIDDYLDPLLLMPVLLQLVVYERSWLLKKTYHISVMEIIIWTIVMALMGEYYFPRWNIAFTADPVDVLFYFAGSGVFYWSHRKTINRLITDPK